MQKVPRLPPNLIDPHPFSTKIYDLFPLLFHCSSTAIATVASTYSNAFKIKKFLSHIFSAPPKRFYKKTGVLYNDGSYEITLDNRKLKTPAGTLFKVSNEALALAVATEWDAQKKVINQSSMHLVR